MSRFSNSLQERIHRPGMILLILLSAATAESQSFLSLNDAISLGMKNNFSIRMARNDSVMAGREVTLGNAGMLPSLQAYASLDKSSLNAKTHTILGSSIERKSAAVNLVSTGLQLHWTLFDGTGMFVEYDKLRSLARLTNLELQDKVECTVFDISAAYFDIARQKQLMKACEKRLETSDLRLSVARSKYRSGLGSEQEMLQAEVIRLADTTALAKQHTFLKTAEIALNKTLGIDLSQRFVCEDTIPLIGLPALDRLMTKALKDNTTFLQAGERQVLGMLDLKLLKSKQLPTVTLRGAYGLTENKTEASLINYSRTFGPSVGVTASVGIFDGLNLTRKITQARTELENRGLKLQELEQELQAEILDAWNVHENLLQSVELGQKGLRLAQKNMAIASEAFSTGMASSLQLREAQEDLFMADATLLEALYKARMIEIALLKISGELVKTGKQGY